MREFHVLHGDLHPAHFDAVFGVDGDAVGDPKHLWLSRGGRKHLDALRLAQPAIFEPQRHLYLPRRHALRNADVHLAAARLREGRKVAPARARFSGGRPQTPQVAPPQMAVVVRRHGRQEGRLQIAQVAARGQAIDPQADHRVAAAGGNPVLAAPRSCYRLERRPRKVGRAGIAGLYEGGPHVLRVQAGEAHQVKIALPRKGRHLLAAEVAAGPRDGLALHLRIQRRSAAQLAAQYAANFERAARLGQVIPHDFRIGDVLENGVGIDEIELPISRHGQVCAVGDVHMGVGRAAQAVPRHSGHFLGDIHPVDFPEMPAHGQHQPPWAAPDLERPPPGRRPRRQPRELLLQYSGHFRRAGQKLGLVLVLAAECNAKMGILPSPAVPVLPHQIPDVHVPMLPRAHVPTPRL